MGGSSSKAENPEEAEKAKDALAQKAKNNGGNPLQLEANQSFEIAVNRGCTDILFLLVFFAFWVGMFIIAGIGISKGDPDRLTYGYDFNGRVCGTGDMTDRPSVFYPYPFPSSTSSIDDADFSWAVCVDKCPDARVSFNMTSPPNRCSVSFNVPTSPADQNRFFGPLKPIVTCGGNSGGTDMSQFPITNSEAGGFFGYHKYCLKNRPLCNCKTGLPQAACCLHNAVNASAANGGSPAIGAQAMQAGVPMTEPMNATSERKQFGLTLGYQYGVCFVPYPSYLPGSQNDGTKTSSWSRCLPLLPKQMQTSSSGNSTVNSGAAAVNRTQEAESDAAMDNAMAAVMKAMSGPGETIKMLVEQVRKYKWVILGCAGITVLVAILYTLLLKFAALPLILFIMFSVWGLLGISVVVLAFKAGYLRPDQVPGSGALATQMPAGVSFAPAQTNQALIIAACVGMGLSLIFYTLMLCVMIPRVRLACIIIDQASLCLASMPTTLVLPIIQFCLTVGLYIYFCIVMFYLASAGKWNNDTHTFVWDYELQKIIVYHFFGLLWGTAFLQAVNNLTIAGAAADWFLADDKKGLSFPAINSLTRTLRYHLGTAAFGSFILAVVQLIRWIFRYYMYQLQKLDKQTGGFMKYPIACLTCIGECCLACLERFLDFINKNAYIQTAIKGNNFCTAAKDACGLLIRNCLRVGTLQMVATVFTFLGKYFIALIVAIISAIWMVALDSGGSVSDGWANVSSAPVFPVAIVALVAFGIACGFLDIWDMVIDTIFQCYCMDEEYGTGKSPGPFKDMVASNPPSTKDVKALDAICVKAPGVQSVTRDEGRAQIATTPSTNFASA